MENLDTMIDASRAPIVFAKAGEVFANSRDVAEFFEKRHQHVLRDIDNIIKEAGPLSNFGQGYYTLPETGQQQHRCYNMDRDGFTLLAMGFTGPKALKWKLAYIAAFNAMEAQLRAPVAPVISHAMDEVERLNAHVRIAAEARRLYGRAAARAMWEKSPLPQPERIIEQRYLRIDPEDDASECLGHLLRHTNGSGQTLGAMLVLALRDAAARQSVEKFGLKAIADKRGPRFAVAEKHEALERIFAGTPWAEDWFLPLLSLDGANAGLVHIDRQNRRAVRLPSRYLATMRFAN